MKIFALSCGQLEFDRRLFFPECSSHERMIIPVPAYLIVHPQGNVLFDTGVHPHARLDAFDRLGQRIARNYRYCAGVDENIVSQLAGLGLKPQDISHIVNSHLHFDHCGGNEFFPGAVFLTQKREMESVRKENDPYTLRNVDHPGEYRLIDGMYDLFGDGKLQLIPTYGHSPGHQSLLVNMDAARSLFLVADACYTQEHFAGDILPKTVWDRDVALASLELLRQMEEHNRAEIYFGHDLKQWEAIQGTWAGKRPKFLTRCF